jgi:hypothetical protein
VVCQVDRLCRTFPASIRSVLEDLPKTLDETYSRTLLGIDGEKREYIQRLFRCLSVSIRPLRVKELAEVLAIQFPKAAPPTSNAAWRPENSVEAVLSACSSLISIVNRGGHQIVQFSHFSVKEYLTSERLATAEERLSYYYILLEPHIPSLHTPVPVSSSNLMIKSTEILLPTFPLPHMPLGIGSIMPNLGTCRRRFRRSWSVYSILQCQISQHGSGFTTSTTIGYSPCPRYI